jgi:hypothetical protein
LHPRQRLLSAPALQVEHVKCGVSDVVLFDLEGEVNKANQQEKQKPCKKDKPFFFFFVP